MSERSTKKRSSRPDRPGRGRADLPRLRRMTEAEIRRAAPPELADLPEDFWVDGSLVTAVGKQAISLRIDQDVLEWFKERGPRYQTRINAVLRSYMSRAEGAKGARGGAEVARERGPKIGVSRRVR